MTGHVFLPAPQFEALLREMALQGMIVSFAGLGDRPHVRITVGELEDALEHASADPIELDDRRLWGDWLEFLDGAARNGGLVVQA